jgi:hypothetical protein
MWSYLFAYLGPFIGLEGNQGEWFGYISTRLVFESVLNLGADGAEYGPYRDIGWASRGAHPTTDTRQTHVIQAGQVEEHGIPQQADSAFPPGEIKIMLRGMVEGSCLK